MSFIRFSQRALMGISPNQGNLHAITLKRRHGGFGPVPRNVYRFNGDGFINTGVDDINGPGRVTCAVEWDGSTASPNMYCYGTQNNQCGIYFNTGTGEVVGQRGGVALVASGFFAIPGYAFTVEFSWDGPNDGVSAMSISINDSLANTGTVGTNVTMNTIKLAARGSLTDPFWGLAANYKVWRSDPDSNPPDIDCPINEGSGVTITNNGALGGTYTLTPGTGAWEMYTP